MVVGWLRPYACPMLRINIVSLGQDALSMPRAMMIRAVPARGVRPRLRAGGSRYLIARIYHVSSGVFVVMVLMRATRSLPLKRFERIEHAGCVVRIKVADKGVCEKYAEAMVKEWAIATRCWLTRRSRRAGDTPGLC